MNKRLPVAAGQQVIELLTDAGHSTREIHLQTKIALQSLNNIKLGRYPKVSEANYEALVSMLGYYPEDVRDAETVTVRPEYVRGFITSAEGREWVDKHRDGLVAA